MDPEHVCFCCTINDDQDKDIITYNELMDYIQKNAENDETLWHFKCISRHQGLLCPGDPHYAGAKYNVQVEWETGEVTCIQRSSIKSRRKIKISCRVVVDIRWNVRGARCMNKCCS